VKIVALSGWKRSGKDMVADYLVQNHGFQRISFADPLKESVAKKFGLSRASMDDQALKEMPLLDMPVSPQDAFTRNVCEFMRGEFRDQDGKRYGDGGPDSQMYWTRRALCILEGSTSRAADSDFWMKQAVAKMDPTGKYVIADLRYISEIGALVAAAPSPESVVALRISRFASSTSSDPSERDLDSYPFQHVIENREDAQRATFAQIQIILHIAGFIHLATAHDIFQAEFN